MVKITQQSSLFAPITKLLRSVKERGWEGTMIQLYLVGAFMMIKNSFTYVLLNFIHFLILPCYYPPFFLT